MPGTRTLRPAPDCSTSVHPGGLEREPLQLVRSRRPDSNRGPLHYEFQAVVLQSLKQGRGAGTALLDAARAHAEGAGCRRVWLVTTSDNLHALRFYQRRGWDWIAMHRDAVVESRRLKPEISLVGAHDIPIRHELEFELTLDVRPPEP